MGEIETIMEYCNQRYLFSPLKCIKLGATWILKLHRSIEARNANIYKYTVLICIVRKSDKTAPPAQIGTTEPLEIKMSSTRTWSVSVSIYNYLFNVTNHTIRSPPPKTFLLVFAWSFLRLPTSQQCLHLFTALHWISIQVCLLGTYWGLYVYTYVYKC